MPIFHVVIDDQNNDIFTQLTETPRDALATRMDAYKVKGPGPAKVKATVYGGGRDATKYDVTKHASGRVDIQEKTD